VRAGRREKEDERGTMMKAWRAHAYGEGGNPADTISKMTLDDVPVPVAGAGQVQIKVAFAAVNPIDWKLFSGGMHGICPVSFPYTPGFDLSGTVSAVGEGVSGFAVGDEVAVDIGLVESCKEPSPGFGPAGAFAEYATVPAELVAKTHGVDLRAAAGLPLAGLTAYQALFTGNGTDFTGAPLGDLKSGQKVLVLGGSSAVGMYAVQLAKNAGLHVAATASGAMMPDGKTAKKDYVKTLGADRVEDYTTDGWSDALKGQDFDLVFDCVGEDAYWTEVAPKVLKKGGKFISIANFSPGTGADGLVFQNYLLKSNTEDLSKLMAMVKEGKLKVSVDSTVPLTEAPKALSKSMTMHSAGKLVVQIAA